MFRNSHSKKSRSTKRKLARKNRNTKTNTKRNTKRGGGLVSNISDWKLNNNIIEAGFELPISVKTIGTTTTAKQPQTIINFPNDQFVALPCVDYTQVYNK